MTFEDALSVYWDAAYAEGQRGATFDTADGRASRALHDVRSCLSNAVAAERERWRAAFGGARDSVLHKRGSLEGQGADSGVINAVLDVLDDNFSGLLSDA